MASEHHRTRPKDLAVAMRVILDEHRRRTLGQIHELVHPKFELSRSVAGPIVKEPEQGQSLRKGLLLAEHQQNRLAAANRFF